MSSEWSIQQLARRAGTTSRTLRHYGDIGLLAPSRVGANGYRYYDSAALVRLQRILLLRELGLGLPQIAEILGRPQAADDALESHLEWLHEERRRLERQIASVRSTIAALREGEEPMAETMFDGFDHTAHRDEVAERWGAHAYERGDRWWRGMSQTERAGWSAHAAQLAQDWTDAAARGLAPDGDEARALAERHAAWLAGIPGTPAASGDAAARAAYIEGLGDLYVEDERFAAHYGGAAGARFVRAALQAHARGQ